MAVKKTITVAFQYQNNANSPVAVSFIAQPTVSGSQLNQGTNVSRPGVFTAGTPQEGTSSNPNQSPIN